MQQPPHTTNASDSSEWIISHDTFSYETNLQREWRHTLQNDYILMRGDLEVEYGGPPDPANPGVFLIDKAWPAVLRP